jgi:hypothetical protein
MKQIQIHPTELQLARLRKGHSIMLKKGVKGTGFSISVDPGKYDAITRTFDEGRGARIRLSPEEITQTMSAAGGGLRTRSIKLAREIFDEPTERSPRQETNAGGPRAVLTPASMDGVKDQISLFKQMNAHLGTNFGVSQNATMGNSVADTDAAASSNEMVGTRTSTQVFGTGLGRKVYRREGGSIGMNGGFISSTPPAMRSQPEGSNFQFRQTLPVAYQRFSGAGLGP